MEAKRIAEVLIALKRLAEDQRGKPEGESASRKIDELIAKYPDLRPAIIPFWNFTTRDFVTLKRRGINMGGSWEGTDLDDALRHMQEYYCRLYIEHMGKQGGLDAIAEDVIPSLASVGGEP
jgi:hypothetical protein